MPIFEYRCPACGQTVEKIQRNPLNKIPCPCGKDATRTVSLTSASMSGDSDGCSAPAGSGFT